LGFYFWERPFYKTDLWYTVARPYWRRGIATEAVRALMEFGFETLCLHRINVDTRMDNIASLRLMQKLGFRHEGVRRECIRNEDGTYQSWGLFGMLENEYRLATPKG
jgi:ribosomal-protein-alanine N-acetyltransferase